MKFKVIVALVDDGSAERIIEVARREGATGCTVVTSARGEGLTPPRSFFGLELETQRDVLLFLVEEHLSRHILEEIAVAGHFDDQMGTGIAFQLDVEDAVGLTSQLPTIKDEIEEQI